MKQLLRLFHVKWYYILNVCSHRSRSGSRSPTYKSQKAWSPTYRSVSKRSRGYSPSSPRYKRRAGSPETPLTKRRAVSPDSPAPVHKRRAISPESPVPRTRYRDPSMSPPSARSRHRPRRSESYSPPRYRHGRGHSPISPARKHKHKHKYWVVCMHNVLIIRWSWYIVIKLRIVHYGTFLHFFRFIIVLFI